MQPANIWRQQPQVRLSTLASLLGFTTVICLLPVAGILTTHTCILSAVSPASHILLPALVIHTPYPVAGLRGEARVQTLQKWCTLLQELHPSNLPPLHCYTVNALCPSSPHRGSCDSDWQQLQLAPPEPPDPNWGHNAASMPSSQQQKPAQGSSPSSSVVLAGASQHGQVAKGSELDFWANQVLYWDQESPATEKELLTFRELFLHSYALQNIIVGESCCLGSVHELQCMCTFYHCTLFKWIASTAYEGCGAVW